MRPAKQSRLQTVSCLSTYKNSHFSLPKGGQKPDLHPRPPDLHHNVPNIIANTPGKLMAPGRTKLLEIHFLTGTSTLPTWALNCTN